MRQRERMRHRGRRRHMKEREREQDKERVKQRERMRQRKNSENEIERAPSPPAAGSNEIIFLQTRTKSWNTLKKRQAINSRKKKLYRIHFPAVFLYSVPT
jgi:hypothetical protein